MHGIHRYRNTSFQSCVRNNRITYALRNTERFISVRNHVVFCSSTSPDELNKRSLRIVVVVLECAVCCVGLCDQLVSFSALVWSSGL